MDQEAANEAAASRFPPLLAIGCGIVISPAPFLSLTLISRRRSEKPHDLISGEQVKK